MDIEIPFIHILPILHSSFLLQDDFSCKVLLYFQFYLYLCNCIAVYTGLSPVLIHGRNQSPMGVRDALQDIAGQKLSIQNSDEVYIQIVGKTSLETRPLGIGIRLYGRTLSLYIVLGPVCRRLGCKCTRDEGALFYFPII